MKKGNICGLCGEEIIAPKGTRSTALSREQEQGAHDDCINEQHEIMQKHQVHPNLEFTTKIDAIIELHPEIEATKAMIDYRMREVQMKKELYKAFPYLKQKVVEENK